MDTPVRDEPALEAFGEGLEDVDELTERFNQLSSTVLARSVPLLTISELVYMMQLDTQVQGGK